MDYPGGETPKGEEIFSKSASISEYFQKLSNFEFLNELKQMQISLFRIIPVYFFLLFLISCGEKESTPEEIAEKQRIEAEIKKQKDCEENFRKADTFPTINYSLRIIENAAELADIRSEYAYSDSNKARNKAFLTLNRKELRFLRVGDSIIVPDKFFYDARAYSVFPAYYCEASGLPKLIIVSNEMQAYACYENGFLVRFAAANTGKESTPTYPGRYSLVWKQRLRKSSLDSNWILPFTFNFHQYAGNAFHQFEMPGRAVSHSCVRQFMSDAEWLFSWGRKAKIDTVKHVFLENTGTPVLMLGMFDYDRKTGPWVSLKSNKEGMVELKGDPMQMEEALIPISQVPKESRGILKNYKRYLYAEDTLRARGIIRDHIRLTPSVNFNKLRREKLARKMKEEEEKKKAAGSTVISTDQQLIEKNLKELNTTEED